MLNHCCLPRYLSGFDGMAGFVSRAITMAFEQALRIRAMFVQRPMSQIMGDPVETLSFSSFALREHDPEVTARWRESALLVQALKAHPTNIYCRLCDHVSRLTLPSDAIEPREHLYCEVCGMNSRVRAGISLLHDLAPGAGRIYMTEQVTPAFVWMQKRHPDILGSEFESNAKRRRSLSKNLAKLGGRGRVRFEDVTALRFANGSLDAVLSFDVLEHVPDWRAALSEFARTLAPGGICIATFPFTDTPDTVVRARLKPNGEVEHLLEPEYHGDPISGGVLCFYHFGWDVLDAAIEAGFTSVEMVMPQALESGYCYGLWTLVARR